MAAQAPLASNPPRLHAQREAGDYARRRPEESILYRVVQRELETFLARAQDRDRPVPRFVEREFRGFLRCGILAHGFVRVHCDDCGQDRVVAFSCKGRGFCPSCGGRRMAGHQPRKPRPTGLSPPPISSLLDIMSLTGPKKGL